MSKTKRIFYYDALRAMAIIGIVFCHVSTIFVLTTINTPDFFVPAFYSCFRDFSIPIFVMLSGALLLNKENSLKIFFKKRLSRILIPFIFWVSVYIVYSFVYINNSVDWDFALRIFWGMPGSAGVTFWYIWMIIVVYIGIFIINKVISFGKSRMPDFDDKFIKILTVLAVIFVFSLQMDLFSSVSSSTLFYYLSFLVYIVIGYFLANCNSLGDMIGEKKIILSTFIIAVFLYFAYIFYYVVPASNLNGHFTYFGYLNPVIMIISINIFVLFKYLSKTKFFSGLEGNGAGNIISLISRYSFGIYLTHYLVLKRVLLRLYVYLNQHPLVDIPFLVIVTLVVCYVILWALNRIPYLNKVSGVN